jgi:hypothetical protein
VFFIGSGLTSLIFLLGAGGWLLTHGDLQPASAKPATAAA